MGKCFLAIQNFKMAFVSGSIWIFLLLCAFPVDSEFRFENCGIQNSLIELSSFEVWPDPVVVKENLTISFLGRILRDIPESSQLEVRYYGIRQIFGLHLDVLLPCLLGKYGSCTLPLCNYMHRYEAQVCPLLSGRNGTACVCPLKAGNYTADFVEVQMARTSAITRFFLKGKYRTEMRLREGATGEELACFKFYTELT